MVGQSSVFDSRHIGDEAFRDGVTQIFAFHALGD